MPTDTLNTPCSRFDPLYHMSFSKEASSTPHHNYFGLLTNLQYRFRKHMYVLPSLRRAYPLLRQYLSYRRWNVVANWNRGNRRYQVFGIFDGFWKDLTEVHGSSFKAQFRPLPPTTISFDSGSYGCVLKGEVKRNAQNGRTRPFHVCRCFVTVEIVFELQLLIGAFHSSGCNQIPHTHPLRLQ